MALGVDELLLMSMQISVILPTYKEADNLPLICAELAHTLADSEFEILVMDDQSPDATPAVIEELCRQGLPVTLHSRASSHGLSPAVIDGLSRARGEYVVVMDADMSHPSEAIPRMIAELASGAADFCLGSRYIQGGETTDDWGWHRRLNSYVATVLASGLAPVRDPMSGFFAFRRADMPQLHRLSPLGYKIALELLVKGGFVRVREIPISFRNRARGESKMSVRVQFNYLRHLRRLYTYRYPIQSELLQFAGVGGSGFCIDLLCYFVLQALGASHLSARALSFWFAGSWNWFWNRALTFSEYEKSKRLRQWLTFLLVSCVGFAVNFGSYALLTDNIDFFTRYKVLALALGVGLGMGFNFMSSRIFVFFKLQEDSFGK